MTLVSSHVMGGVEDEPDESEDTDTARPDELEDDGGVFGGG